jgi:hypothetical protein
MLEDCSSVISHVFWHVCTDVMCYSFVHNPDKHLWITTDRISVRVLCHKNMAAVLSE